MESNHDWVLETVRDRKGRVEGYVISNRKTGVSLLIENDELYEHIIQQMLRAGIDVVDPPLNPECF